MKAAIEKRGIKYVWHFSRVENVPSILEHGLISRATLEHQGAPVAYNDEFRWDGARNANCVSIGHPNYKMFYSLRQKDPAQEWVVFAIKPEILWQKDCAFCYENAASGTVTSIPIENRKGVGAFENLFSAASGKPSRAELALPDTCPTNPQAEILVFDTIEPQYILGAICQSLDLRNRLRIAHPNTQFEYHRAHFSARVDFAHWK